MNRNETDLSNAASILGHENHAEPSVFTPANLLWEVRRQKALAYGRFPRTCVLDPDDDIVKHLGVLGAAAEHRLAGDERDAEGAADGGSER